MARILRIDHIGLAVQDEQAARFWEALGKAPERWVDKPDFCYREFFTVTVCRAG